MIPHGRIDVIHEPHYVYRLYDDNDALLYVGCTARLTQRLQAHKHVKAARVAVSDPMSCYDAYTEEARAIRDESPQRNRRKGTLFPDDVRSQADLLATEPLMRWFQRYVPLTAEREEAKSA